MPRRQPIPLLRTIGPIQATVLVVQEQSLQAPGVAERRESEIRSGPKYEAKSCTSYIGVLGYHSFWEFWTIRNCELGETDESGLALRATGRPPSRTPLSQSASALLNVKAFNLGIKVHQNCALPRVDLPSSTWQQPGHLGFMLHACREWLHRQVPLLVS